MIHVVVRWWRTNITTFALWLVGISALVALYVPLYRRYEKEGLFGTAALPDGVSDILGLHELGTPAGFLGATLLGPVGLLVMIAAGITLGAGALAGTEERGLLDTTLTRGVSRFWVYVGRAFGAGGAVVALGTVFTVLLSGAVWIIGLPLGLGATLAAGSALTLLALFHGSLAFALGAAVGHSGFARVTATLVALAGFAARALGTGWAWLSPFQWAMGEDPLTHGLHPVGLLVLALATTIAMVAGQLAFLGRDLNRWRVDSLGRP
jgi:ABC-2 type transport system permease protein